MSAHLEVWAPGGARLVPLGDRRIVLGRTPDNDVPLPYDRTVSSLHAVVERVGGGWCVRDLGSRNGTWVGGERIVGDRALRGGDELLLGHTRIVFRTTQDTAPDPTESTAPPPVLTRRERDVLVALCRPLFRSQVFSEPASVRQIAAELFVGEAAVKQHLLRLYEKFGLDEKPGGRGAGTRRRVQLANEAVDRGVVTWAELGNPGH